MWKSYHALTAAFVLGGWATIAQADLTEGTDPGAATLTGSPTERINQKLAGASIEALGTTRVATGLNRPVAIAHAPGDASRLFVTEKPGNVRIIDLTNNEVLSTPFLNITGLVGGGTTQGTERGLLGLAFHPDYDENGYFFVHYTNNAGNNTIARYQVSESDPNVADPGSALILLTISQPFANHNGGWIGFGPDGYLYIAVGDGGSGNDPQNHGQNPLTLLGTMLRIDVDNTDPGLNYAIPSDNPFVGDSSGADQVWAWGLRHPWRNSFDRLTGDLYIADVGQFAWEEVNVQPANSPGGENYGWRCYEGNAPNLLGGCASPDTMVFPVHVYPIGGQPECAIIGGYVYRGSEIPTLDGYYIFGDYCSAKIWAFHYGDGPFPSDHTDLTSQLSPSIEGHAITWISSFGEDANGEVYIVSQPGVATNGAVFRIISVAVDPPPNNACEDAIAVDVGVTEFDTSGATTTGPDEPDHCAVGTDTNVAQDIWFTHEATCTGELHVALCGSGYATKLGVYGDTCPEESGEILACDFNSCDDNRSEVTIDAVAGETYIIRVGGRGTAAGEGILTITCEGVEPVPCPGDLSGPDGDPDGTVDVFDLIELINQWGSCDDPNDCPADLSGPEGDPDGTVDVFDLIELINNWGECPA